MSKIEIQDPLPTPEEEKKVFNQYYEDCGVYYLLHPIHYSLQEDVNSCLATAVVHLVADKNSTFASEYGKAILLKYIQQGPWIYAFREDWEIIKLLHKHYEGNIQLSPEILLRSNRMRMELLAAAHFCEEMHDTFGNSDLFTKFRTDIPLVRFENFSPKGEIGPETFEDTEWTNTFKCFALRVLRWLDEDDKTEVNSQKLLHRIEKDYGDKNYFIKVYNHYVLSEKVIP